MPFLFVCVCSCCLCLVCFHICPCPNIPVLSVLLCLLFCVVSAFAVSQTINIISDAVRTPWSALLLEGVAVSLECFDVVSFFKLTVCAGALADIPRGQNKGMYMYFRGEFIAHVFECVDLILLFVVCGSIKSDLFYGHNYAQAAISSKTLVGSRPPYLVPRMPWTANGNS